MVFDYFNCRFDKYIVFAEGMQEYLPKGKPCMLLEGFAPERIQKPHIRDNNIAMYAGGLAEDNGIRMMIEAAHKSEFIDELWICGVGDRLEYVKENAGDKVKYLGRLTNDEVISYERRAKVLLNVRDPDNELTKFSFPLKVLEYMAAGGIVISSKLQGIPKEYYQYVELIEEYNAKELAKKMDKVFSMPGMAFKEKTENALEFIKAKSAESRCRDVLHFVLSSDEMR